jgi:hypothetical protein
MVETNKVMPSLKLDVTVGAELDSWLGADRTLHAKLGTVISANKSPGSYFC